MSTNGQGEAYRVVALSAERSSCFGIVGKVIFALLSAFALSLLAMQLVWNGFGQIGSRLAEISGSYLPAIARTAELVRESQRLVALGPDILLAQNEPMRDELRRNLERSVAKKNRLMAGLGNPGASQQRLELMDRDFNELAGKFRTLMDQVGEQKVLEQRMLDRIERLQRLSENIARLEKGPPSLSCPVRWESLARQAIVSLLAAQGARSDGQLWRQQDHFTVIMAAMEHARSCSRGRLSAKRLALNEEIRMLGGRDGMFDLRRQQLEWHHAIENHLARGRYLGEALMDTVHRAFANVERETQKRNLEVEAITSDLMARLALMPIFLLLIAMGVYLYLHRVLLRPVQQLRTAIGDSLAARPARFPEPGSDEIGTIVRAMRDYIDILGRREEELRCANQAKSLFLAQMSHELRSPLSAILGYAELLGKTPGLDGQGRARCELILHRGEHLLHLIEDLLDSAAIEAGSMRLAARETDLDALLGELEATVRHEAEAKGLSFQVVRGLGLPRLVQVDSRRLRQVLFNLLDNAVKYTPSGQIRLHATVRPEGGERARLAFLVADTGPGIPLAEQSRLFKPFEQLDASQPGNGLGLPICRELVALMGGVLKLDSTPGQGSRFMFEFVAQTLPEHHRFPPPLAMPLTAPGPCDAWPCEGRIPPMAEIQTGLELARLGRLDQVLDWCADLSAAYPEHSAYAQRVGDWVRSGDICGLCRWLERQGS